MATHQATRTFVWVLVSAIVSVFAVSSNSLSCDRLCYDPDIGSGSEDEANSTSNSTINSSSGTPGRCILNSSFVEECCAMSNNSTTDVNFTMKFSGSNGIEELRIADMIFENCAQPIMIEDLMSVEIINVNFSDFTSTVLDIFNVTNVTVDNCTFENNYNFGSGTAPFRGNAGAIAVGYPNETNPLLDANITIKNSMFINNNATTNKATDNVLIEKIFSGRGGAIALYLPTPNSTVRFTSESNCFTGNIASSAGGGIYAHLSGDFADVTLHVKDCNFTRNEAQDGAGLEFTYDLDKSACAIPSCDMDNFECSPNCQKYVPANSIIENCCFIENHGDFGGAFKGIQINPFGNNNLITFTNCTFINNTASVGAGAYFQSRYSVADVRMNDSIKMEHCTFMNNSGPRSIVFMIRNRVDFVGHNKFENNEGPSIRLVGTLVVFNGTVEFLNNRHHSEGLSGALYLSSFGQMLLAVNASLNFTNNTGSDGAAIVVKSPRVSSSFSRQLYNPQCFLQYANATESPSNWNATMRFAGNKARVGPVMFVSNLAACEWYSLDSSEYFQSNNTRRWGNILEISEENCNCIMSSNNSCSNTSESCDIAENLIQTEVSNLQVLSETIKKSPGENVRVDLKVLDERDSPTIAFLKIDITNQTDCNVSCCNVTFEPSIIPVNPEDKSINFKFRSTRACEGQSVDISISAPFAINPVEPRQFMLEILPCLPGFTYEPTTDDFLQCNCNTESNVLYCSPDQTAILLKDGTWAANPNVSGNRKLITSPCPARYCNCEGLQDLTRSGCALNFSESICVNDRKGWLCGECNQTCGDGKESGIGVLTTKCRCSGDEMYRYLVPLVVLYGVVATMIIVFVNYPFPSVLKGILYYVQVSAICTQFFPEDFNINWEIMDCIASGLSLYYPYDFDFMPGLTAITAYGLRYIPVAIVIIIAPIALWIRMRFHPKMVFEGIWTLVLLTYAHLVYASASIVNCHELDNNSRWFINGAILCYKNEHLGLAFLAIISLIFTALLIIFTLFIIYHPEIKYFNKLAHRVKTMAKNLRSTLISGYRPNYIFWPAVELIRRYVFILAVVVSPGDLTLPLLLILVVFGAHVFVYPYEDKLSNHIESFVLFTLITVLMLGNTTAVVEKTRDTDQEEQFFVLLFVPLYLAFLLFACYLIYKLCCLIQRRFNINIKSWNFTKRSGLLNMRKNVRSNSTPQVTCTHIDLSDHNYQPLSPDHGTEDDENLRMRFTHNLEDDER